MREITYCLILNHKPADAAIFRASRCFKSRINQPITPLDWIIGMVASRIPAIREYYSKNSALILIGR